MPLIYGHTFSYLFISLRVFFLGKSSAVEQNNGDLCMQDAVKPNVCKEKDGENRANVEWPMPGECCSHKKCGKEFSTCKEKQNGKFLYKLFHMRVSYSYVNTKIAFTVVFESCCQVFNFVQPIFDLIFCAGFSCFLIW